MIADHKASRDEDVRSAAGDVEPRPGTAPAKDDPARLEWLFRESIRRRTIHPLLALVRGYRAVEKP
jgi:hypothetical protein